MSVMHLVAFNVPFPPNQGGVIDVYAKIKALKAKGVDIILHAYLYDRPEAKILEELCFKVYYYPRNKSISDLFSFLPFIVFSRRDENLYDRLMADDYPILLEGLHSCFWLGEKGFGNKKVWVRAHNIEHDYYAGLAKVERSIAKKLFFALESFKLKRYEKVLSKATGIFCIAKSEIEHYKKYNKNVELLSAFHLKDKVSTLPGLGTYALYHGSLDVAENENAAFWLIDKLGPQNIPLKIAGNNASSVLKGVCRKYPSIELVSPINTIEMEELIRNAQVHVLPTFQNTGIKLKLLHALFNGRFSVVNKEMVEGSGLEKYCKVASTAKEFVELVKVCLQEEFSNSDLELRKQLETSIYSNEVNVEKLISVLQLR